MGGPAASARRAAEGGAASLTPRRHRGHRRARTRHTSNTHSGARSAESDTRGAVRWRPRLLAENTTRAQLRALHAQSPVRTPQRLGPRVCVAGRSSPHVPLSKLRAPSPWSWRRVLRVSRLGRQPARTQLPRVVSSELRSLPRPHRGQGCPALLGRLWPATSQGLRSRPPRSNPASPGVYGWEARAGTQTPVVTNPSAPPAPLRGDQWLRDPDAAPSNEGQTWGVGRSSAQFAAGEQ